MDSWTMRSERCLYKHVQLMASREFDMLAIKCPTGDIGRNLGTWAGVLERELGW